MKNARSISQRRLALVSAILAAGMFGPGVSSAQAETSGDQAVVAAAVPVGSEGSPTVVPDARAPRSYEFAPVVPVSSSLQPAQATTTHGGLTGEILVVGPAGSAVGAFDAPWAQDATGQPVKTSYEIHGTKLIQTVVLDSRTTYPVTLNAPIYSAMSAAPMAASLGVAAAASLPFVAVPADYIYNPALGSLHDYCTDAPDEFPAPFADNADFRGPCARHDMCYQAHVAGKSACDDGLHSDMDTNCNYEYSAFNPLRGTCRATADIYWAAVVVAGGY